MRYKTILKRIEYRNNIVTAVDKVIHAYSVGTVQDYRDAFYEFQKSLDEALPIK